MLFRLRGRYADENAHLNSKELLKKFFAQNIIEDANHRGEFNQHKTRNKNGQLLDKN